MLQLLWELTVCQDLYWSNSQLQSLKFFITGQSISTKTLEVNGQERLRKKERERAAPSYFPLELLKGSYQFGSFIMPHSCPQIFNGSPFPIKYTLIAWHSKILLTLSLFIFQPYWLSLFCASFQWIIYCILNLSIFISTSWHIFIEPLCLKKNYTHISKLILDSFFTEVQRIIPVFTHIHTHFLSFPQQTQIN